MPGKCVWIPTPEYVRQTRVWQFMHRHGIPDRETLIKRASTDIAWFWDAVVAELPIAFFSPYERVLDDSRGIAQTRWFVGGTLNVAHNCLDRHTCDADRDRKALIWEGEDGAVRELTYAELFRETNRIANALKRLGVDRGDRVGIFMPMAPEAVAAFLACAKIGAISTPIFSGFAAEAVAARLNDCNAKILITADGTYRRGHIWPLKELADEAARLSPTVEHLIVWQRTEQKVPWTPGRDLWWHDLVARESNECPSEEMDSEAPFLIAYTSGTTGKPKGAVHVHGGFLVKIAQEVAFQVDMRKEDTLFWITDLGWIMGPWEIVGGLALGGTVMLYEGAPDFPGPDRVWALVERHRPTILGVSPTLIRALMRHGVEPVRKHDRSSLRILASTGEPWNPDPWLWYFENVGDGTRPVINFSGGTEAGACFLSALPMQPLKPCSLGGPSLGMAANVFDSVGQRIVGGVGELVCTKPWPGMTRGLWNDDDRFLQTYWSRWPGTWVHGDWASIDEDGEWFLHGRSDDTLNVAGKRIGPAEVESAAVAHPAVAEAAAVGVPHELKGESIWCFVILRHGFEPSETLAGEIKASVIASLGKSFAPDRIRFVKDLPRTRSAKILRRALRAKLLGQDPGDLTGLENPRALDEITPDHPSR